MDGRQSAQSQRFSDTRMIDHERRNAAPLQLLGNTAAIDHLLDAVEAVAKYHAGRVRNPRNGYQQSGEGTFSIRDFDSLAGKSGERNPAVRHLEHVPVGRLARTIVATLHSL